MKRVYSRSRGACLRGLSVGLLFGSLQMLQAAHAEDVGAIAGEFSVSSGTAAYSIPIQIPQGVAGMQPDVSLNYSSQGGNGLLGLGWSIGGLSTVHRCPATIVQDGVRGSVKLNQDDRFCLDGQRLIAVTGVYGEAGTEYRTELDGFSRITSVGGSLANGPDSWLVETKAGQTFELGNTADSKRQSAALVNIYWQVNRITDAVGNEITYTYHNQADEHYLTRIDYGGHSVQFEYDPINRPDPVTTYSNGVKSVMQARLTRIASYHQGVTHPIRSYTPSYTLTPTTSQSRLESIEECAGNGNCLPKTTFTYDGGQVAVLGFNNNNTFLTQNFTNDHGGWYAHDHPRMMADVDGDGLQDIVGFGNAGVAVRRSSTGGGFAPFPYFGLETATTWSVADHIRTFADVNGDGLADIVGLRDDGSVQYALSQGDHFSDPVSWIDNDYWIAQGWSVGNPIHWDVSRQPRMLADFDGDGKVDVIGFHVEKVHVILGSGQPFAELFHYGTNNISWDDESLLRTVADVNGDGLTDIVGVGPGGVEVALSEGDRFSAPAIWLPGDTFVSPNEYVGSDYIPVRTRKWHIRQMADANGDGLPDLIGFGMDGVYVALSTGTSFLPAVRWIDKFGFETGESYAVSRSNGTGSQINGWHETRTTRLLTDLNGDGRADIIGFVNNAIYASLSTGNGFSEPVLWHNDFGYDSQYLIPDYANNPRMVADINGDGLADALRFNENHVYAAYNPLPQAANLVKIRDGNNIETDIEYNSIAGPNTYYEKQGNNPIDSDLIFPIQIPLHVVTKVGTSDGVYGKSEVAYRYGGLRVHKEGRGLLGYEWTETENLQTGFKSRTTFEQHFPHIGVAVASWTKTADGITISESSSTPMDKLSHADKVHFPYLASTTSKEYELNGALVSTETVYNDLYDDYGNVLNMRTERVGGGVKIESINTNTYYPPNITDWHHGRLERSEVLQKRTDLQSGAVQSSQRFSAFEYYATTGLLKKEIIEPDDPDLIQTTTYTYDPFGNKESSTIEGAGLAEPRITQVKYDANGRYPEWTQSGSGPINGVTHKEFYTHDPLCGKKNTLTGPNGLTTTWTFDDFCRSKTETRADGTQTVVQRYRLLDGTRYATRPVGTSPSIELYPLANVHYKIVTTDTGKPPATVYYDQLGRELRKETVGFDNKTVYQDTEYDNLGRVTRTSRNYYVGDPIHWVNFTYDILGRVTRQDAPADHNGRTLTRTAYNGLSTTVTDPMDRLTTSTKDVAGNVVRVDQPDGAFVINRYDAYNNLTETEDAKGDIVAMTYDDRGRKRTMDDPDMGHWEYRYNAVGELIWQKDAKGQEVTLSYDVLGRMRQRIEPEGITDWTYDTQPMGVGKLATVSGPDGYAKTVTYDALGRAETATTTVNGQDFTVTTAYDTVGRVKQVTRPGGFIVENVYDANGYLLAKRSPAGQVTDYDKAHLDSLQALAVTSAADALAKAEQYAADAAYYEQWADTFRLEVAQNANVQYLTAEVAALQRHQSYLLYINQTTGEQYLESPDRVMILHGDIDTPIMIPPAAHYQIVPGANSEWTLQEVDLATWSVILPNLVDSGDHVFFGDYNGDGTTDYIRSAQSVENPLYDSALLERLGQTAAEIDIVADTLWSLADDALARASQLIAVAGQVEDRQRQAELWAENSDGQDLTEMADTTSGAVTYWQANTRDAEHRLTGYRQGNGLVTLRDYDPASGHLLSIQTGFQHGANIRELEYRYDALDNVTSRHDHVQGVSETFHYDNLDRLQKNSVSGSLNGVGYSYSTDYEYDLTGNITYKSDVGSYTYGTGNTAAAGDAGPSALTGAGPSHTGYTYDNNGNVTAGGGRVFEWTSFNKPRLLQKGATSIEFTYGPDRARYLKTAGAETTVYIGKLYEKITEGTKTTHKHFIYAGGELAAIQIKTEDNGAAQPDQTRYMHTDALGSVDTITDGFGNIVDRMGFDPFGMRRAGNWDQGLPLDLPAHTNRGFTGHEHVDEVGVIHMNGRIYDPELGRFLGADPHIQSPLNSQSHNRYSYVLNNPLKYTDPSGYFLKKFFKKYRVIIAIVAAVITGGAYLALTLNTGIFGGFAAAAALGTAGIPYLAAAGAIGGFVGGAISTGSFKGAVKGAIFGGLSAGIARYISTLGIESTVVTNVLHGVAQGALSEGFGGEFKSGFIGAFVGHSIGEKLRDLMPNTPVGRTIAAAVTGGVAAKLGGGKFANGAVSAAFAHLFNNETDVQTKRQTEPHLIKDIGALIDDPAKFAQCTIDCAAEVLDIDSAAKAGVAASGLNVLPASGKPGGATPGTSLSSRFFRWVFGETRFPGRVPAPTLRQGLWAKTTRVGTFAGRVVPIVGTASFYPDAREMDFCVATCVRPGQ